MKTLFLLSRVLILSLLLNPLFAATRDTLWKEAEEARNSGLPKTAIEKLGVIATGAIADKAWPEAIKAVAGQIVFEAQIQGAKPEEKITRMEAELAKAPAEMQPVMQAILANWYWEYFQQNRWQFTRRTQTTETPGKDFKTWDLPRLYAEIDSRFTKALANHAALKAIKITEFDALLVKGTVPDSYRPTLYDFLAHDALGFYASGEQARAKAEDEFQIAADGPVFGTTEEFLKWDVANPASQIAGNHAKAVRLYAALMRFHADAADKSALLHCDLERIRFGKNFAVGEEKNARHSAALKRFAEMNADHELSAWARAEWAAEVMEADPAQAHAIAKQGAGAFAASIGGKLCHNLIQQIEAKSLAIETDRVWNAPWPVISARYRNFTTLHFRLVKLDWAAELRRSGNEDYAKRLLGLKPERAWKVELPATPDYRERGENIPAPLDVKPGYYALIASPKADFSEQDNVVQFSGVWVSDLALVMRTNRGDAKTEGFVLDARSGEPIEGAEVQFRAEDAGFFTGKPTVKTDRNGFFSAELGRDKSWYALATFKEQQLASDNALYSNRENKRPDVASQTIFFTDRSLYRPGQTIQYKGICIRADRDADKYNVLGGQAVTVIFTDVNGKEIAKAEHKANDYGSFGGSFTAPRDRLMGRMMIRSRAEPRGQAAFNVEEYKRPKFQVALETPKAPAKLGEKVSVPGKATAYTGAAIDGAKVRWRVTRNVRLPNWWGGCFWWRPMPNLNAQEIAHGTAVSRDDGGFDVEFTAKPDAAVSEKDEPVFGYSVTADVTDTTGETRSASRTVNVGYTSLKAFLAADEWLTTDKPVDLRITAQSLDGDGRIAEGVVKIHKLKQPAEVMRAKLGDNDHRWWRVADKEPKPDPANPDSWELGEVALERAFTTDGEGKAVLTFPLQAGPYRAMLETKDAAGKKVTARLRLDVLKLDNKPLATRIPNLVSAPKWTVAPGTEFMALWGTGYEKARAFIEVEHRGKMVQAFWTEQGLSQQQVKQAVTEAHRGGFTLHVTMVRENRAYLTSHKVEVPWSNKELTVKWEHFTSKLEPAAKETWTAVVSGPDAKKAVAEMVAALYDQSLDAYLPHRWQQAFGVFRQDFSRLQMQFENELAEFGELRGGWEVDQKEADARYRAYPGEIATEFGGMVIPETLRGRAYDAPAAGGSFRVMKAGAMPMAPMAMAATPDASADANGIASVAEAVPKPQKQTAASLEAGEEPPTPSIDLSKVSARKNLQETAFFFPQLLAREDGSVAMQFTMPEALTTWRFIGFAHDRELRSGYLEDKVVTAKDVMVQPNPPRFLREGDELEFTVKVSNQSATRQSGKVRLTLADARTGKAVDAQFANATNDQAFDLPSKESRSFSWKLKVPDGAEPLSYKAVGSTERASDGEEGLLPVLSRRTLVSESLPLPIRGAQTKTFDFTRLLESGKSDTLKSQSLTVQMVSNPSWYAVMALPYLMEFPHECSEQTFNRLYANALARHIAMSDPKIRAVFDQWKGTAALDSPLEKNADIKSVMLEETPWVREAAKESSARKNVGVLFADNRLAAEIATAMRKLADKQLGNGLWPWFPGGRGDDYITLYITTGFGRLRHLGVKVDAAPAVKALAALDAWMDEEYRDILKAAKKSKDEAAYLAANHFSSTMALYLYGRSFFIADKPVKQREALDYFLGQARKHWLALPRQSQGHAALALKRFVSAENKAAAQGIVKSLRERSVSNEEMGMFWRDAERSWWWQAAPIETQALMIEVFDEVAADATAVEDAKVWLIKSKQTQNWKTTKATADAVYALLLRGEKVLASDALVEVSLGGTPVKPERVEAGTGFYEQKFVRGEVKPELGKIAVKKSDSGVSWGSVHWQYLEDMAKVTAYEGTPLKVTKALFTKENTPKGPVLQPVKGKVKVGDELVVRITLHTDRDMEYVHLKDHRGSGTEPVNVLSGYRWQDGLGYYETTRDTAGHWFFDRLPKGNYVFEATTRVQHRGRYQTGFASLECMYAPEFGGHSESLWIDAE